MQWILKNSSCLNGVKSLASLAHKSDIDEIVRNANFYFENESWREDYSLFYQPPSSVPQIQSKLVHGLRDGSIIDLKFESSYKIRNPAYLAKRHLYPENDTVHARYWQHSTGAAATIVALHGWTMGDQRLNSLAFLPGHFYKLGYDIVLVELPFHGRRRPKNLSSDEAENLFPGSDLALTNEVIGQFIGELRQIKLFIEKYGTDRIGCMGMSLGAYFASLWCSLDPLDFCIPIVPVVSMADIGWQSLCSVHKASELENLGLTKEVLERGFSLHCPLSFKPKTDIDRIMILAGLADTVIPSSHPRSLWEHWKRPRMHWFRGGHLAHFKSRRCTTQIVKFLKELH